MQAMYSQMMERAAKLVSIFGQKKSSWGGFKLSSEKCAFEFQVQSSGGAFKKAVLKKFSELQNAMKALFSKVAGALGLKFYQKENFPAGVLQQQF